MGWQPATGPVGRLRDRVGRLMYRQVYERPLMPRFDAVRGDLGLERLGSFDELVTRSHHVLVLTSPAFDFPARLPGNVEYVGPQLESPGLSADWPPPWSGDDDRPLVVVGLSTTHQAQDSLLERIIEALATLPVRALVTTGGADLGGSPPPNVHVARYVPHARVLPDAALVVTHAGLGTVHAALAHGLPMVCMPIGRDQPDNAARVAWHGAGVRLSPNSRADRIAATIRGVLDDPAFRASARRLAASIAEEGPADRGPAALERVAERSSG
jgi:MGT family glycosyltransferase